MNSTYSDVKTADFATGTDPYASGDLIGQPVEIPQVFRHTLTGLLSSVVVRDKSLQDAALEVWLFESEPNQATYADNDPLDLHELDLAKVIQVIEVPTANYHDLVSQSVAAVDKLGKSVKGVSTSLWAMLVSRDTPTYTGGADLSVDLGILQN